MDDARSRRLPVASSGGPGAGARRARLRRAATASLATAAIALGLGVGVASAPANAEDATTPAKLFGRHWGTITYVYRVPRKSGPENAIGTPSTYSLLDGKTTVTAYPLEFGQSIPQGNESDYHEVHWDKFTPVDRYATWDGTESTRVDRWKENAKKIRWILAHSAPQQEAASVLQEAGIKGVAAEKAFDKVRDATGSAIWNLTSGAELFAIDGATMFDPDTPINENNSQVFALYQWLLNNAADSAPPPKPAVTFNATDTSGISRTILPRVRLDTTSDKTTIKAALPEGVALKLTEPTAGGKTESYTDKVDVKVSAPGAFDLSLKVEAGTEPRNVEVTATADVPAMPVGSVWSQATSGQITNPFAAGGRGSSTELITNRFANYQLPSLVLAKSSTVPLSDTTNFSWTAPVATPPSTTTTTPPPPPQTPTPPPSTTPTPTPTPTPPPPPHKPPWSKPKKAKKPALISRTFQVDRYTARTSAQARALAALDDDRRLTWREDRPFWGSSRFQFVTVRVLANATAATVIKAVNAQTTAAIGDVTTTERLAKATRGRSYVVAWELGTGASARHPWGPRHDIAQRLLARS